MQIILNLWAKDNPLKTMVARAGIEPATQGFSGFGQEHL